MKQSKANLTEVAFAAVVSSTLQVFHTAVITTVAKVLKEAEASDSLEEFVATLRRVTDVPK